jgi:AcrR family transcriptional regulator
LTELLTEATTTQKARPTSEQQILSAALDTFARMGYHGTSVRQIATRSGVSVAGLYHHFPSKRQILERLMDDTMDQLIAVTSAAVAQAGDDPVRRLKAAVAAHVRFHIEFQKESFVGNTELRVLVSPARERILRKRARQRAIFSTAVDDGTREGSFTIAFPVEASRALVTMCTSVANWYRPDGALSADAIVTRYCELALAMLGCNSNHSEET